MRLRASEEQLQRLIPLLQFAVKNVPFYRTMASYVAPETENILLGMSDFERIPFLTKEMCRENQKALVADGVDESQAVIEFTSGTTGIPLRCLKTRYERIIAERHVWKARLNWGRELATTRTLHVENVLDSTDQLYPPVRKGRHIICNVNWNAPVIPQFKWIIAEMDRSAPQLVRAPVPIIRRLTELMASGELPEPTSPPRVIELRFEYVSDEERNKIENVLHSRVAVMYASREVYAIGYSCPNQSMHVLTDNVILESIPVGPDPEIQETIVTSLVFKAMPFVRYKLGDLIIPRGQTCVCGSDLPVIDIVAGRSGESFTASPPAIGPYTVSNIIEELQLYGYDGIDRIRVIQPESGGLQVFLVPGTSYTPALGAKLIGMIEQAAGPVCIELNLVGEIPPHRSGKTDMFISEIDPRRITL